LWIGTAKGLARWKDGKLTLYKDLPNRINAIAEDLQGNIWIARSRININDIRGPLCRVGGGDPRCFGQGDGIFLPSAMGLAIDTSGNIWIYGNKGLCKWKGGVSTTYFQRELAGQGYLMGVAALSLQNENHFWVSLQQPNGNLELREFNYARWTPHRLPRVQGPYPSTNVLFIDPHGALWIGTASDGVYRISGDKTDHFANADGLSSDSVERFFQDREGILWVASTKGIDSFRDLPVVSFSIKEGLASDSVSTILASHDGGVWIGGAEALGFLKQDKLSAIRTNHGLPGRDITTMFEDHWGRLWVGVDAGLSVLDHGRFLPIGKPNGAPLGVILGIAEDTGNNEWVLTATELVRVENLRVREEISPPQQSLSIVADPKEGVWLGFVNGDLVHYYSGHAESFPADPTVSTAKIRMLLPESGGGLWGVTSEGLVEWSDNKRALLTTRNGLPCDQLYAAVTDKEGTLWLYSRCGLLSIAASQLSLWQRNQHAQIKVGTLDIYDGVQPGITPLQPQATRSMDGRLWFANNNIVQTLDPKTQRRNKLTPNVIVERVAADDVTYPLPQDLKLPALVGNLEIDFTALSFVVPQKVRFRYKLEGHDSEWTDSQGRRQAFYTNLAPRNYRFRVMACNNSGVWNEAGASLDFSVAPAYYQTNWFRALCAAALLGLFAALYQFRVHRLARQFNLTLEARVNEQTRIARELHDTLLQSFQGLLLKFQVVSDLLAESPAKHLLESAINDAAEAITEGRDAVQDLRSSTVVTNELHAAISALGQELAANQAGSGSALFRLEVEGTPRDLHPILRDEIYRIAAEALRNAFRHSEARRIESEILYEERQLRLRVRDDGKGLDPAVLRGEGRPGHYGLGGMRERATLIGARLDVWSKGDSGTEVELTVPASRAYATPRVAGGSS
jgi:signal transduction histidine kinase/ligand-binding sensor domain-containing protein